jgi:hypothetical protein
MNQRFLADNNCILILVDDRTEAAPSTNGPRARMEYYSCTTKVPWKDFLKRRFSNENREAKQRGKN